MPSLSAGLHVVEEEAAVILAIEQGLADAEAGRLVPHDEAMARLDAKIAPVERETR